jgi:hypothetical protein
MFKPLLGTVLCAAAAMPVAHAEFTLNFQPAPVEYKHPSTSAMTSVMATTHNNSDNGTNPDTGMTPYLIGSNFERPEIVIDPDNGKQYYHMIVGNLSDGFIQETYIEMGFGTYGSTSETTQGGAPASASGGGGTYSWDAQGDKFTNPAYSFGNGYDPLDMEKDYYAQKQDAGNGTGNPNKVLIRQIVNDGEIMMEYLKDKYLYKARISQMLIAPDVTAMFDLDMRNSTYTDNTTPGVMTNIMQLWGDNTPPDSAMFDPVAQGEQVVINAGKYTYADGAGFGGSEGDYTYSDGGFDHMSTDWASYMDPAANNPWSFEDSKVLQ